MKKKILAVIATLSLIVLSACSSQGKAKNQSDNNGQPRTEQKQEAQSPQINWTKPSEDKPYPKITPNSGRYLRVSIAQQRVFVMSHDNNVLYTMYASTGKNDSTPKGSFQIQPEHGNFFYNQSSGEGAKYWTSFKDHGIYLFHTVPTDEYGRFIKSEARQLGKEANSHGCVRLSIPDAKWINRAVPVGTKVIIS
ncbi:L,D-transpeptidase [Lentilactobacillus sp. Marseille-Q4993]|uniref:L,D-transpeptidase n=1 Tax=Lentilactobacillus sp. Marseille-Q4993 TaxID=3039492 RepID=UPI0024BCF98C|nr:L,D-transpeptidase [Lentilactobacillus sp. Marseille-Q4993]